MKMVCKAANRYGGQKRAFGDEVEVHRTDVRLVSALGWFVPFTEPKRTAPVKAGRLDPRRLAYNAGGEMRHLRLPISADMDELIVAVLRDSRSRVSFAYNSRPPAAVRQARLW